MNRIGRRSVELCALLTAAVVLASCRTMGAEPAAAIAADDGATMTALIDFGVALRSLEDADLERLHEQLMLAAGTAPSSAVAIRLAMLLSYRDSPHYDLDRAINLFNQIARTRRGENPVFHRFAELMSATLIERRSLAVDRDFLAQAHADDTQRIASSSEQIESLQGRLEQAQGELAAERERSERLQSQLDALIELEEQLTQNGVPENGGDDAE